MESYPSTEEEKRKEDRRNREIAEKFHRGTLVTEDIDEGKLRAYLEAGKMTGFTVKEIARTGQEFPVPKRFEGGGPDVVLKKLGRPDRVAVSIELPKGSKDFRSSPFSPFWECLESLKPKKV